jgi:hypothetical protein
VARLLRFAAAMRLGSPARAHRRSGRARWFWFGLAATTLVFGYGLRSTYLSDRGAAPIPMPLAAAAPILRTYGSAAAPFSLREGSDIDQRRWTAWVAGRDRDIRERLERGDEESIVNLWLFGTSFTSRARATADRLQALGGRSSAALLLGRADDLVAGMTNPGTNERLRTARHVLERAGIRVARPSGRLDTARFLFLVRDRMTTDVARLRRERSAAERTGDTPAAMDAYASYYRKRGLSTDASLLAAYSIERALDVAARTKLFAPASISRVAIVGPGLDFVDKAEGHDVYPPQTLQPVAIVDSLRRLGLEGGDLEIAAFDINPRVLEHVQSAVAQARSGRGYVVHLPLDGDDLTHSWHPEFVGYWNRFGDRVGVPVPAITVPTEAEGTRVRAVTIRPDLMQQLRPINMNVVLQRLAPRALSRPFDLIVATNILVYYSEAEQALAFANMLSMLRDGGAILTNTVSLPVRVDGLSPPTPVDVVFDQQSNGDTLFWFTRER